MRMMLKVSMPTDASNAAFKDESLGKVLMGAIDRLKPEAAYFFPENGKRTALYVFDMKDEAQIPVVVEPFFHGVNADITLIPVMNADDVAKGIGEAAKAL
jgi:hypothetical protein